jgi:aminopeptidase
MTSILKKYADLLVHYCVEIKEGDTLYITSSTLAEPLLRELYRSAVEAGATVEMNLSIREQERILLNYAGESQLKRVSPFHKKAMEEFDTFINIRAPFNLRETQNVNSANAKIRQEANQPVMKTYFERTATRDLRRSLCQFPTIANAQEAGMSLEEYQDFIFKACKLYDADPIKSWKEVGVFQQHIVDYLDQHEHFTYKNENFEISFNTKGRKWINSDGKTNMPSGEVYTSPVEDSVNGTIYFSYPGIYMGKEVEGVRLYVKDGYIEKWEAERGKEFLDHIFSLKGTRRFGEAAIGTNTNIQQITKNILFDEKMGGSVHMAIGQSYLQAGGKNESSVHWDMITDMKKGGQILADGVVIYENGKFLI